MTAHEPLLELRDLSVRYPAAGKSRPAAPLAVDAVSLTVRHGQTLGLVGESGSGKSTIGGAILGLVQPVGGQILHHGTDITHARPRQRRALSGQLQVVFQDPYSSLNPSRTIGQTLADPLLARKRISRAELDTCVGNTLESVGLSADAAHRFPGQFSGGQRQRIAIARALILQPELVVCDEPTSSLDVSVQAQVLNMLRDLQVKSHLSYLFISHDIGVIQHVSHYIAVLLHGRLVEHGPADAVAATPSHPYTRSLLAATPVPSTREQAARRKARASASAARPGPSPSATDATAGCPFASRCPHVMDVCRSERPAPRPAADGVRAACHLYPAASS